MIQYLDLLRTIKEKGTWKNPARENMPRTLSVFGHQYRCDLQEGFPLLTTKKMHFKGIVTELLWFLRGGNPLNIKYLVDNGCNIWNQDAYRYYTEKCYISEINNLPLNQFIEEIKNPSGGFDHLKPYGYTYGNCPLGYELWRNFNGEDQIKNLIEGLKKNPEGRRHLLTAYDPSMRDFALAPCHVMAQFNCRPMTEKQSAYHFKKESGRIRLYYLDCQLYQRSCDVFLGVPYNTASYALLTHIIAEICGFEVGEFIHTFGDVHIYEDHMQAVDEQLKRTPDKLPKLKIFQRHENGSLPDHLEKYLTKRYSLDDFIQAFIPSDFKLENYNPQHSIKANLSTGLK